MKVKHLVQTLRYLAPETRVSLPDGGIPSIHIGDEWRVDHRRSDGGIDDGVAEYYGSEAEAKSRVEALRSSGHRHADCIKVKALVIGRHNR